VSIVRAVLFVIGYPVAIVVIIRFVPVVRRRRLRWFVAHEIAVSMIVSGWALDQDWQAVAINGTWLVVAAVWYVLGGRRPRARDSLA
jgi:hypothetical protein